MMNYMTILSAIATTLAIIALIDTFREKDFRGATKYILIGLLLALIDLALEYAGTSTGQWHYEKSLYFIAGLIPIELIFIFFSSGILLGYTYAYMTHSKLKAPIKLNIMLYSTIILALAIYIRELYLGLNTQLLVVAIPIGIWGILNISNKNREGAFAIALFVAITDLILEIAIIRTGGYHYVNGFTLQIPMTYGLMVLGLLGVIEQFHKLDVLLEKPFVQSILRWFGVQRFVNHNIRKK